MAISTQSALLVKQKVFPQIRKPNIQFALKALFSYLAQFKGNPDLQMVPFAALDDTETIIADAACKIYATYMKKGAASTAATYVKQTDHATTSSDASSEFRFEMAELGLIVQEECVVYFNGAPMTVGVTMQGNTTPNGGTAAAAIDGVSGFVIIGAP